MSSSKGIRRQLASIRARLADMAHEEKLPDWHAPPDAYGRLAQMIVARDAEAQSAREALELLAPALRVASSPSPFAARLWT